jgi:hypothetical protein
MVMMATWTPSRMLELVRELERMQPGSATWTHEALASNPPRLVRLKRIEASARAFDVPANPEALWSGNFLRGRPPDFFEPAREAIVADIQQFGLVKGQQHVLRSLRERGFNGPYAEWLYKKLAGYLRGAYDLLAVNEGTIEASGVYLYGLVLLEEPNHKLRDGIARVERIVDHILSPTTPPMLEERLREYGWPEESLTDLDMDWY